MKDDTDFLNLIYQNAKMGIVGIDSIKGHIKDEDLLKTIKEQERDYYALCDEAVKLLLESDACIKDVSDMAKLMTYVDAQLKTTGETSNSQIAKMMIKGSNTGIVEIQEKINNYKGTNKKVVKLAKKLLNIEKRNLEDLKKYL